MHPISSCVNAVIDVGTASSSLECRFIAKSECQFQHALRGKGLGVPIASKFRGLALTAKTFGEDAYDDIAGCCVDNFHIRPMCRRRCWPWKANGTVL